MLAATGVGVFLGIVRVFVGSGPGRSNTVGLASEEEGEERVVRAAPTAVGAGTGAESGHGVLIGGNGNLKDRGSKV